MVHETNDLKSSIIHGFGTLIIREVFIKFFSFLGQVVLARILVPEDFGVYVIIVFIVSIFNLFSDIGLSQAIIQKKVELSISELSGIFWLKVILALILIFLIFTFSPFIKIFYPALNDVNIIMLKTFTITILLSNLRTIPISLLERKIQYNLISIVDIIGVIIYYVVAIVGALLNFGIWSLIAGAIIKEVIETIIFYFIRPFIPHLIYFKDGIKKMIKFGIYMQGNGLIMFFISSLAPAVAGRTSGPYAVGLLDFASSIVSIPAVVSINFGRVAFAGYSRIQGEKEMLSKSINKSVSMLAILLYIFPVIFLGLGKDLIYFIYTEKWIAAVPALYWLSISVFFYPTITSLGQIILSLGKSKEIFLYTLAISSIGLGSAFLFINKFGFTGIAMANVLIYIGLYLSYIVILKKAEYEFNAIYILIPKLIAAICSVIFIAILNILLPTNFLVLIIKLLLGTIAYLVFMLIFARRDMVELLQLIFALFISKSSKTTI